MRSITNATSAELGLALPAKSVATAVSGCWWAFMCTDVIDMGTIITSWAKTTLISANAGGSIVSIIGPNGAGKTSLLNMISGFYKPDTGRVVLDGSDITHRKPSEIARLGIARTFQNIALFSGLTVLDNLMLGRHVRMKAGVLSSVIYWGMAQKEDIEHREAVEEIIEFLKLQDLRKLPTAALAYGLRKRVELGRALALDPELLFLDEPTAGLDPIGAAHYDELVRQLQKNLGLSILMVTHDLDSLYAVCDRIAVLLDKRVVVGTMEEMLAYDHPWVKEYFHGPRGRAAKPK